MNKYNDFPQSPDSPNSQSVEDLLDLVDVDIDAGDSLLVELNRVEKIKRLEDEIDRLSGLIMLDGVEIDESGGSESDFLWDKLKELTSELVTLKGEQKMGELAGRALRHPEE